MKHIFIGDIHGRFCWEDILKKESFDGYNAKVVFIGDYFDTKEDVTPAQQLYNFNQILQLKIKFPNNVILLLGNHDYHYLPSVSEQYSGYQPGMRFNFQSILENAIKQRLIQICYVYGEYIAVHAGISNTWCKNNHIDIENFEWHINELFYTKYSPFKFTMGQNYSRTGNDICQTPIWIRPQSLCKDMIFGYKQIVGHTQRDEIEYYNCIWLIDCLGTSKEYFVLENGKEKVRKL